MTTQGEFERWRIRYCTDCFFADLEAIKKGEPCCTYAAGLPDVEFSDIQDEYICKTRRPK